MILYDNNEYISEIKELTKLDLPWNKLQNKSILISGASGLIGSYLIDVLMKKNVDDSLNCLVFALGRNERKLEERFSLYASNSLLRFIEYDIQKTLVSQDIGPIDYVLHLASNTHPMLYATDPIGTILTNVIGVKNMLDFAVSHDAKRFAFASSNEMYGENRGDVELFDEDYCGYINCNTLRAGYPESKRCGEALCQAYRSQKGLDIVIPRLTRTFGPTMIMSDTKAASQFIKKGVSEEDIILKSEGTQFFSYTYVADAVSGLLTVLLKGISGEAYNVADERGDIMLKDLATIIAGINGKKVIFEIPDSVESAGYSIVTKARLDGSKLKALGWEPQYSIETGMRRTIDILRFLQSE
jgi:nucleoside-diphosphate-sugar epimerase